MDRLRARFGERRQQLLLLGCLAALVAIGAFVVPAGLALTGSKFESTDGNLILNDATRIDWCNDFPAPTSPTLCLAPAPNLKIGIDKPTGSQDDSFTGGSTHEAAPNPPVGTGTIPNNKSDLTRFYVASDTEGGTPFMYLAWERATTSGDANMDFEFNQSSTIDTNGVTPVRTDGDVLITYDFSPSKTPVLGLATWVTPEKGHTASECIAPDGKTATASSHEFTVNDGCWGNGTSLSAAGKADGAVNDGFSVYDPIGITGQTAGRTIASQSFGEAAIDLKKTLGVTGTCIPFATAFLKSRSSSSFNADLKDFIAPIRVSNCGSLQINKVSSKTDSSGNPIPVAGATFTITPPTGLGSAFDVTDNGAKDQNPADGVVCVDNLAAGTYSVVEKTPPTGYSKDTGTKSPVVSSNVTCANRTSGDTTSVATFTDKPLSTIEVKFTSLAQDGSGNDVTKSQIRCTDSASTPNVVPANTEDGSADNSGTSGAPVFDDHDETFGNGTTTLTPGTYVCTVIIDP